MRRPARTASLSALHAVDAFPGRVGGFRSARRFVCESGRTSGSHSVTRRRARREAEGRLAPSKPSCAGRAGGRPSGACWRRCLIASYLLVQAAGGALIVCSSRIVKTLQGFAGTMFAVRRAGGETADAAETPVSLRPAGGVGRCPNRGLIADAALATRRNVTPAKP
jgi:hypothetical protein